jgi:hypothetical protein
LPNGKELTDVEIFTYTEEAISIDPLNYYHFDDNPWFEKNDSYLCFGKEIENKKYPLMIKTNTDCFDNLLEYIYKTELHEIVHKTLILEKYEQSTKQSIENAISFVGKKEKAACNICTRSALYYLTDDPVLFPKSGSSIDGKTPDINGEISGNGGAASVVSDLNNYKDNNLKNYFTELEQEKAETFENFLVRLQNEVDNGEIIIGTYSTNHVFMLVPGGLIDVVNNSHHTVNNGSRLDTELTSDDFNISKGDKYGFSFYSRSIKHVPRILECGIDIKSDNAPIYANMDYKGSVQIKWYKYIKNKR